MGCGSKMAAQNMPFMFLSCTQGRSIVSKHSQHSNGMIADAVKSKYVISRVTGTETHLQVLMGQSEWGQGWLWGRQLQPG